MASASEAGTCVPLKNEFLCLGRSNETGQTLGAAGAGDDAEQDLGLSQHRSLAGNAEVTAHGKFGATTQGESVDGSDGRTRHRS
jgi:hypothetical protein